MSKKNVSDKAFAGMLQCNCKKRTLLLPNAETA